MIFEGSGVVDESSGRDQDQGGAGGFSVPVFSVHRRALDDEALDGSVLPVLHGNVLPSGKDPGIDDRISGQEFRSRDQEVLASEGFPAMKGSKGRE
ncbi:hypothetical protein B1A_04539 [mine drainage metagenome]|uniref:Uncharacterized protein n=1 Tax=mine drainage metagenome TaxID=410659 RepID=T1CWA6_9ZZZZ